MRKVLAKCTQLQLPRVIGHRGAPNWTPENTLVSFHKAKQSGAHWVEFDLKLSRDGTLFLMHDETLDRTTDGHGLVDQANGWSHLKTLSAGEHLRFKSEYKSERVPTLSDALSTLTKLKIGANVEIKPCPGREVSTAVAAAEFLAREWPSCLPPPLLSSFCIESLQAVKRTQPQLPLGVLFEKIPKNWLEILRETNSQTIHVDHEEITKEFASAATVAGYPLLAYTVNSPKRARQLFSWGVTAVFSDCPWAENS